MNRLNESQFENLRYALAVTIMEHTGGPTKTDDMDAIMAVVRRRWPVTETTTEHVMEGAQ